MRIPRNIAFSIASVLFAGTACCQSYPSKPIRIIAAAIGGTNDIVARLIAQPLSTGLGQQVIVDNRGSVVGPEILSRASPDGYTLFLGNSGTWLQQYLRSDIPYAMTDFEPVSWVTSSAGFLVVHSSVAANSVKELVALARARPGTLNYGTGSPGNLNHTAPELFKLKAGINVVGIPYKGGGPALAAVVANQAQYVFVTAGSLVPLVRSGRVKVLAVTSLQRSEQLPDVPTMVEAGFPGFEVVAMNGILARARTPAAIIRRLNQEIVKVLHQEGMKQRMLDVDVEPVGSSPAEFAAKIKSSMEQMGDLIKAAGIRIE